MTTMREGVVVELGTSRNPTREGFALRARRPALAVLVCALPLLLLASLTQAISSAANGPVIVNPYIVEASGYLHANGTILYYSDLMGAAEEEFWLGGEAEGADLDYVRCSEAFGEGPFVDDSPAAWECGPYDISGLNSGDGFVSATLYDTPTSTTDVRYFPYVHDTVAAASAAAPPAYNGDGVIPIDWTASDGASGVGRTYLYYRTDGNGTWSTSHNSVGTSGIFFFVPTAGDDVYYFQTLAVDNVGNPEAYPSGGGDGSTIYDTVPPSSAASSPSYTNLQTIPVSFTVAPDFSGLDYVRLYYRHEGESWAGTAYTSTESSGVLDFAASDGDGSYDFQTIAIDNAGNPEAGPSGGGDTGTLLDTEPPTATVDSPPRVGRLSWQVSWLGHDPAPGSGVALYDVQYQQEGGLWQDWLTTTVLSEAAFGPTEPITVQNHLTFTFRARAYDLAGNQGPWGPVASTAVEVYFAYLPLVLNISYPWDEYYEENDHWLDAYGPLERGSQYRAYPNDRDDYYYFELSFLATIRVNVTGFAPTSSFGDLLLYGPVTGDEQGAFLDQYGVPGSSSMLIDNGDTPLQPGKYYIRVYTVDGHYSTSQLYTLSVTW
jgi:hypothetical protein